MARKKKQQTSEKEHIEELCKLKGIGRTFAEHLLRVFKTPKEVYKASETNLQTVLGIKRGTALHKQIHKGVIPDVGRNTKYDQQVAESIAKDYAEGSGTIVEIMEKHDLHEDSFYRWQKEITEFYELIKIARQKRKMRNYQMALRGKQKLLEGYEVVETSTIAVPKINPKTGETINEQKQTTINRKHVAPSSTMIIFELINSSEGEYRDVRHINYEGVEQPPPLNLESFTDEELKVWLKLVNKAQNSTVDK